MAFNSFDEFVVKLNRTLNDCSEPLGKVCALIENEAKRNCPVDTGQLRESIRSEVERNEAVVGTNLEYAPYVEYGTGVYAAGGDGREDPWTYCDAEGNWHTTIGQMPQPFLEPAYEASKDKIDKIFIDYIKKELR